MKSQVFVLPALLLCLTPIPAQAMPAECNFVSYWRSRNGSCTNLDHLTHAANLTAQAIAAARDENPLVARGMRIAESRELELQQLTGSLLNQSSRSVGVLTATFEISIMRDGQPQVIRTVTAEINALVSPGATVGVNQVLVGRLPRQQTTIRLVDATLLPVGAIAR